MANKFRIQDGIIFPDGTEQTTAYIPVASSYKGFQAIYGRMYDNDNDENGPINKIVIYQEQATPSSTIDTTTENDDFTVTGLSGSVVALLVVVGENVVATPLAELKSFAESVIDNVILDGGVAGVFNTVEAMKDAFYDNYATFSAVLTDRKISLEFFTSNNSFNLSPAFATGKGATFYSISYNMSNDTLNLGSWGQGGGSHINGDIFVIPGDTIQDADGNYLSTPANDVTVTVTATSGGNIQTVSVTGTLPRPAEVWPENYINDGGNDEYDGGNQINTNLESSISYNGGNVVTGSSAFGGGDYVVTYQGSIFGIFAVNAAIDSIGTSGGSGFDGDGQADTGSLYPETDSGTGDAGTGDITFDGSKLSSPALGSGDWPNGIITLAPGATNNTNLADYGQYINIYPTNNYDSPHIHIAPGFGSNSNGSLILGNDNYHVEISNNGSVYVRTNNQNHSWEFGTSGHLRLPAGGDIQDSTGTSLLNSVVSVIYPTAGTGTNGILFPENPTGGTGDSAFIQYYAVAGEQMRLHIGILNDTDDEVQISSSGPVEIVTGAGGNNKTWIFETGGNLIFPDNTIQSKAYQIVSAPAGSEGSPGDKQGMVAYDADYHYYCKADFVSHDSTVTISSTEWGGSAGELTSLPFLSAARAPEVGWTIYAFFNSGPATLTITGVTSLGDNRYQVDFNSVGNINVSNGNTGTLTDDDPLADIWVRAAWTGSSW